MVRAVGLAEDDDRVFFDYLVQSGHGARHLIISLCGHPCSEQVKHEHARQHNK